MGEILNQKGEVLARGRAAVHPPLTHRRNVREVCEVIGAGARAYGEAKLHKQLLAVLSP